MYAGGLDIKFIIKYIRYIYIFNTCIRLWIERVIKYIVIKRIESI
jgi:hypothetical protein